MSFSIGVAMAALAIIAVRGAFLFMQSSALPTSTRDFLSGQVFAVVVTGMLATGPILMADALASGAAQILSAADLTACAAAIGAAVVLWIALGRWAARRALADPTAVSERDATPPTRPTTHGAARKRAA